MNRSAQHPCSDCGEPTNKNRKRCSACEQMNDALYKQRMRMRRALPWYLRPDSHNEQHTIMERKQREAYERATR